MLNLNMEFIQAFNPLYAIPIVAVILCAFIVYAFGFKSPVPPPSFEAIEEDKKYSKKKRSKDTQKKEKLLQNGKVIDSALNKSISTTSKKKDTSEKSTVSEKPINPLKSVADKKSTKKPKLQTDKKLIPEKKKESTSHEDFNDDGWVQLVSKKGRKNKKKDDAIFMEGQSIGTIIDNTAEPNKEEKKSPIEESVKINSELPEIVSSIDKQQHLKKELVPKAEALNVSIEKSKNQNVIIEVSKSCNDLEKQTPKIMVPKEAKVLEESGKSKKKKKKSLETANEIPANMKNVSDSSNLLSSSAVPQKESLKPVTDESIVKEGEDFQAPEVKTSNVAFDELAGLYPETKEQKKKKKVRRDH